MNKPSVTTDSITKKTQPAKRITDYKSGIIRWIGQMTAALLLSCFILFLSAGTLNWLNGWIYLGMNAFTQVLSAIVLIPRQPDMLDERSKVREGTKGYDRFLAPAIVIFGTLAVLITAGLDDRFGWTMNASIGLTGLGIRAGGTDVQQDVGGEMGLVARVLATEAAPSILLVAPGDEGQRAGPVAVRYDGSPAAASALATASRFLVPDGDAIVVLLEAQGSAERREREETARSHLKSRGLAGVVRHLSQPGAEGIAQALRAERARLLVMAVSDRPSDARLVADLARVSRTPVLLVPGVPAPGPS